jgi:formiminotetrahydrofolate cyclodeaminase
MSGGSLEYASFTINRIIENLENVEDKDVQKEIEQTIKELQRMSNNLYQLEWYLSGDIGIESMQLNWEK